MDQAGVFLYEWIDKERERLCKRVEVAMKMEMNEEMKVEKCDSFSRSSNDRGPQQKHAGADEDWSWIWRKRQWNGNEMEDDDVVRRCWKCKVIEYFGLQCQRYYIHNEANNNDVDDNCDEDDDNAENNNGEEDNTSVPDNHKNEGNKTIKSCKWR